MAPHWHRVDGLRSEVGRIGVELGLAKRGVEMGARCSFASSTEFSDPLCVICTTI